MLITLDFEKAFDSLYHGYIIKVLQALNFGPSFIQWVRTFYCNVSSCAINNGLPLTILVSTEEYDKNIRCRYSYLLKFRSSLLQYSTD